MVRPKKFRYVSKEPVTDYFKPRGIPLNELKEITLSKEEYEALRLKEIEKHDQKTAAELMNISQPTYSRVLDSARNKVADSIINGKALKIEGGVFKMVERKFKCLQCQYEWDIPFGTGRPAKCPKCQSSNIYRTNVIRGGFGQGRDTGRGKRRTGRGFRNRTYSE